MNEHLVIVVDCGAYTERLRVMKAAHPNTIGIRPADLPLVEGFHPITIPEEWMPLNLKQSPGDPMSFTARRGWWAFNRLSLAAVQTLGLDPDFVLAVESDCVAIEERWRKLMVDLSTRTEDCLVTRLASRANSPNNWYWSHPATLPWMEYGHIGAIYRLSRFGMKACTDAAVECREAFGEVCIASCVARAGGTLGKLNGADTHYNCQTMQADPYKMIPRWDLICHPVKGGSADVPKRSLQFNPS